MKKSAAELVAEAKAQIENLDADAVEGEMASGDVVLVDIRDAQELDTAGRIPGSIHIPRGMLEFRADPSTPYHQEERSAQWQGRAVQPAVGRAATNSLQEWDAPLPAVCYSVGLPASFQALKPPSR